MAKQKAMERSLLPVFTERFFGLFGENETQEEFGNRLGLSRNTIAQYLNGHRIPDSITLKQICERCNVSADWLLGLSDVKKPDTDLKAVCEYTGLSEEAVNQLHSLNKTDIADVKSFIDTINQLLEQDDEGDNVLEWINAYLAMDFQDGQIWDDNNTFIPYRKTAIGFHKLNDDEIVFCIGGSDVFESAVLDKTKDALKLLRKKLEGMHDGKPTESR